MDVQVSWVANNSLDAYVFNAAENAAYANSNATRTYPNIASLPNSRDGSLSFQVPANDTYYLASFQSPQRIPWLGLTHGWAIQRNWHCNIPGYDHDLHHTDHVDRGLRPTTSHLIANNDQQLSAHHQLAFTDRRNRMLRLGQWACRYPSSRATWSNCHHARAPHEVLPQPKTYLPSPPTVRQLSRCASSSACSQRA